MQFKVMAMLLLSAMAAAGKTVSVRDFGAMPDGGKSTAAFAKAIESVAGEGGVVHVPAGKYVTGQIVLRSNVTLDLAEGATILFSADPTDYLIGKVRWEGTECQNFTPLIFARGAEHIAITGKGTLDGNGKQWWDWSKKSGPAQKKIREMGEKNVPVDERKFGPEDFLRPNFIGLYECKDVRIEGVTIINSPMWIIHPVYCDGVVVRGCNIKSAGPNTDGCDPDSSRNVLIEGCTFECGDDCIAIKSGRDADGRRIAQPTEHIQVKHCIMNGGHAGVAIGSEMSGGIRDVTVTDCKFDGGGTGIRIKTTRGRGGVIENIHFDRITMSNINGEAIIITMAYQKSAPEAASERTPVIRDVTISNSTADGAKRLVLMQGLEERSIERVKLSNLTMTGTRGLYANFAKDVTITNVKIEAKNGEAMVFEKCEGIQRERQ